MTDSENTIITTIARMNPPTPGHLLLVERMILEAAQKNLSQINIILSHSIDENENPLDCPTKRDLYLTNSIERFKEYLIHQNPSLERNIENINVVILCMDDPFEEEVPEIDPKTTPILKAINYILFKYYRYPKSGLELELFVGDDRDYNSFLGTSLRNKNVPVGFQQFQLERKDMSIYKSMNCLQLAELDIESVPLAAMSASFVRNLVKCQLQDSFFQVMRKAFLDDGKISELYHELTETLVKKGGNRRNRKINKTPNKKTNKTIKKYLKKTKRRIKNNKQQTKYRITNKYGGNSECEYDKNTIVFPDNYGCINDETEIQLNVGTILDRFGYETGFFLSNDTSTYDERSLAFVKPGDQCESTYHEKIENRTLPYYTYQVIKPFNVKICEIAPWFGHRGHGKQYRLFANSITDTNEANQITPKNPPFLAPEKIPGIRTPNIAEMIYSGYLKRIANPNSVPKFR
jgi:hypothetical protein